MNIQSALQEVNNSICKIKEKNIEVSFSTANSINNNGILKSSQENVINQNDWKTYTFNVVNKNDLIFIMEEEKKLNSLGVYFDTGYSSSFRTWEIDWSLKSK